MLEAAKWIWSPAGTGPNQYICFRKKFFCNSEAQSLRLCVSADSDFIVYLNGERLTGGQFSDWPEKKTYTSILLNTKEGENIVAILAYYRGITTQCYAKGLPGLIAEIEGGVLVSDDSWKCLVHPAFTAGNVPLTTFQLGYTIEFDARKDLNWLAGSFDDSNWNNAQIQQYPVGYRATINERPVTTILTERLNATIIMQGSFIRRDECDSFAETVAHDYLRNYSYNELFSSPKCPGMAHGQFSFKDDASFNFIFYRQAEHNSGFYVVADLKKEAAGMLEIELIAPDGAFCDIAVGEHLEDGRVRAYISGRNFADRYICKAGHNIFRFPFRRVAGRYIELHLGNLKDGDAPSINYLGIVPVELELPGDSCFKSNDGLTNKTHEIAARTLKLCMHEHYEDCPWREQALYAYDSRNQMLYGYYLWGNYKFAATSLSLLGNGMRPDGLLELCAPSHLDLTIPIFSMAWVAALAEYQLHSGDASLTIVFCNQIKAMIETILPLYKADIGLFACHEQDCHWPFYEWSSGLDGTAAGSCFGFEKGSKDRIHAGFNLYFYEMLNSYLEMLHWIGEDDRRLVEMKTKLAVAIHNNFWDADQKCYASKIVNEKLEGHHEHIQVMALYNKIVPENKVASVVKALTDYMLVPISFSAMSYLVRALMEISPETRTFTTKKLEETFHPLIFAGCTTLWETAFGASDFDNAGSLCHAWSSISVYFAHACTLGVKPISPGFETFLVAPYPGCLYEAYGTIATPRGFIKVKWNKCDNGIMWEASGPQALKAVLHPYPEVRIARATYNGKDLV